jgi:site-specific recombinase XerD
MSFDREVFDAARQEFLAHLRYAKGHRATTCYGYHADLGQWRDWLQQAGKDWQRVKAQDVEGIVIFSTAGLTSYGLWHTAGEFFAN